MAKSDAVWGIDIGQCALKALRCRPHEDPKRVVADAYDFIEYPKILSQPDVDPAELIQDALQQFLSRNSVRGDKVLISVAGQSGLARFIKLPPVESKKIPDIVRYEARQQIPFALEDVVWDYQRMAGGSVVEGFAMETEVGLFAMKRDQVLRALKPFQQAGIEVDVVQLTPLALYNYVAFDQMPNLPPPDEYDPESPPDSVVLLSLGTDTTDIVVTNGFRVWQRSIPLGGNHFTKALTKELKLTFATAEHQKRNALHAEDTKALFQAMRPVFNDLLTEVQRSIGYFTNLDRKARIKRGLALGNAMKLPGLQRYLAQNLGFDLDKVESFRGLGGTAVVDSPVFKENLLSFGVCYGLALQGLRDTKIKTNLLPGEITRERLVRSKKPWAVGAAAALLVGVSLSFVSQWRQWNSVLIDGYFGPAVTRANNVVSTASTHQQALDGALGKFKKSDVVGQNLLASTEGRQLWLDVLKAINICLPADNGPRPHDIPKRNEINVTALVCQRVEKLEEWYTATSPDQRVARTPAAAAVANPDDLAATATPAAAEPVAAVVDSGPTGPGWVFQITAHHYHNAQGGGLQGLNYAYNMFAVNFLESNIGGYPVGDLGIKYPILIEKGRVDNDYQIEVDDWDLADGEAAPADADAKGDKDGAAADGEAEAAGKASAGKAATGSKKGTGPSAGKTMLKVPRFDFVLQFCWQEPPPKPRELSPVAEGANVETAAADAAISAPTTPDAATGDTATGDAAAGAASDTATEDSLAADDPALDAAAATPDGAVPDEDAGSDAAGSDAAGGDAAGGDAAAEPTGGVEPAPGDAAQPTNPATDTGAAPAAGVQDSGANESAPTPAP